jgi:hypothetical protein
MKRINNCKTYDASYICSECNDGFYPCDTGNQCIAKVPGCLYKTGKCYDCYKPFIFDSGKCRIIGCTNWNNTCCQQCQQPFVLTPDGLCQITNCVSVTPSGSGCATCQTGYNISSTGACTRNIDNCDTYNGTLCNKCHTGYYLAATMDTCIQQQPGCIYDSGVCKNCTTPFAFKNSGCMIEGCLTYDNLGCTKCVNDKFTLFDHVCRLPQCAVI